MKNSAAGNVRVPAVERSTTRRAQHLRRERQFGRGIGMGQAAADACRGCASARDRPTRAPGASSGTRAASASSRSTTHWRVHAPMRATSVFERDELERGDLVDVDEARAGA